MTPVQSTEPSSRSRESTWEDDTGTRHCVASNAPRSAVVRDPNNGVPSSGPEAHERFRSAPASKATARDREPASLGQRLWELLLGPRQQTERTASPTQVARSAVKSADATNQAPAQRTTVEPQTRSAAPGRKYTDHANEVAARRTTVKPQALKAALRRSWPELSDRGAELLVAQSALETGNWRHCYNFNLGNTRADQRQPHVYLRGAYESVTPAQLERLKAAPNGQRVRQDPSPSHQAAAPRGKVMATFDPPHEGSRFRAYASLDEGIAAWSDSMKRRAAKDPDLLPAFNRGDANQVAEVLGRLHYFTASKSVYATGLERKQAELFQGP